MYGTCDPPEGEGGCAPPLQLETRSVCDAHPLVLDGPAAVPRRRWAVRGALAATYGVPGEERTDLVTGATVLSVHTHGSVAVDDVLAALRPAGRLAPPALPPGVHDALREVRVARARLGGVDAVRAALGISRPVVRDRLDLERDLRALGATGTTDCRGG